ncbi:MAG: exodeoxyribonuclease large subunit [Pseudomonadota bacterium]|jgi:exodeoxyribonuclease VII large subunit
MMPTGFDSNAPNFVAPPGWRGALPSKGPVWEVAALVRAVADLLDARLNPVQVKGELAGFARAASGHCYFTLKDANGDGQLRCAMFKRAAGALDFMPRDGDWVELRGKLGVYEARGDLQLIVESMRKAGQGTLFEQFMQLKARLEAEGLFDASRKRPLVAKPRAIGLVTSVGAAALHDAITSLLRRVPHIPVVLSPASVQGPAAPQELIGALHKLYKLCQTPNVTAQPDVILLVRGGGSLDDLWAFNDEALARTIAASPVPLICGVGHETDFTIADFVADLRAPTPTAAAELCATPRADEMGLLVHQQARLQEAAAQQIEKQQQRLDWARVRLGRPQDSVTRAQARLQILRHRMGQAMQRCLQSHANRHEARQTLWNNQSHQQIKARTLALARLGDRLALLDPSLVLQRGYAWLQDEQGRAVESVTALRTGQTVKATLADGEVDLGVQAVRPQ